MMESPAFQFYPEDWLSNIKLQLCSMTAQGLLINLICLMHQSEKYGYLLINGSQPDHKMVMKLLRMNYKTFNKALNELLSCGVLKEDEEGVIYCKRMVKDEYIRNVRRESGKRGGNPALNLVKQEVKQEDKQKDKQKTTPSSSSSSSSSKDITTSCSVKENTERTMVKFTEDDMKIAKKLDELMEKNNPTRKVPSPAILKSWANDVRLMREIDKRTHKQIESRIEFSQQDHLWCQNILSMKKLRKQYDQLTMRMKASKYVFQDTEQKEVKVERKHFTGRI